MEDLNTLIQTIFSDENSSPLQKIERLTALFKKNETKSKSDTDAVQTAIENAIEEVFGQEIRRLNEIREKNLKQYNLQEIEELKTGYAQLFTALERTLQWNPDQHESLYGIVNRASLRAMMVDPRVSVKTKKEIIDNWEDYM